LGSVSESTWVLVSALGGPSYSFTVHGPEEFDRPEALRPRQNGRVGLDRVTDEAHPGVHVFHAGTALHDGRVVVSGGRVMCVTALGDSVRQAQRAAYAAVGDIRFDGMQYRTDIGHRAVSSRKP